MPAGTQTKYDVNGHAEDFADIIYSVSPEETPFVSGAGRGPKVHNTLFQWQTDSLAAPAANAKVEGADATYAVPASTTTVANYTQISSKTVVAPSRDEYVRFVSYRPPSTTGMYCSGFHPQDSDAARDLRGKMAVKR